MGFQNDDDGTTGSPYRPAIITAICLEIARPAGPGSRPEAYGIPQSPGSVHQRGFEPHQVTYLQRQRDRINLCLDWLERNGTRDGFAPDTFSIMDLNLICALGNVVLHGSSEWRDRPTLEAITVRYQERPSVKSTSNQ
jgi:glutathione S-transferase